MKQRVRVQLLFGLYKAPALHRGDRAFCLYCDADVVVTSWTDARISWPRCRAPDIPKGGVGLLICEELARAVRNESEAAIAFWWGVNPATVVRWRNALGVTRTDPEGSRRLIQAAAHAGADAMRPVLHVEAKVPDTDQRGAALAHSCSLAWFLGSGLWSPFMSGVFAS